jgi:hypothetical protein
MDKVKFLEMVRKKSAYSLVRLILSILHIVSIISIIIFVIVGIVQAVGGGGTRGVLFFLIAIWGFFALVFVTFSYQLSLVFLDIGDATMHSAYVQHISVMRTATKE